MKKQKYWFGVMDFQGYELHVVSATKREAEQSLLDEYKKHPDRELDNPTFDELQDWLGIWMQECELNKVI